MRCTVVVPCYNEAARFPVDIFRDYLARYPDINFVLVNDGSKDGTLALLEQLRAAFPAQVAVLDKKVNAGKGEAVRAGVIEALRTPAPVVGFWDADLATPLTSITELLAAFDTSPDIRMVFGSRVKLMGRAIERKPARHYLGRVFATVVSLLLRLPIYDTQCGAKLFRSGAATESLFAAPFSSRWVFDVEIIARFIYSRKGNIDSVRRSIYEYPLTAWRDVGGSKVRPKDFVRAFVDVVRIYRKYRTPNPENPAAL